LKSFAKKKESSSLTPAQAHIHKMVAKKTWAVMSVLGLNKECLYSYSVGMHYLGFPDLLVIWKDADASEKLVNACCLAVIDEGNALVARKPLSGVTKRALIPLDIELNDKIKYTRHALEHYGHTDYNLQQLVIPNAKGEFPWDLEGREEGGERQSLIAKYPTVH
jgi:hypothetical protein